MSGKENVPKEGTKNWQDEEALKRYRLIAPLLDLEMDEGKRRQLREETAGKEGISLRSLYRYEKKYREEGFGGLRPAGREKRRDQRLPENFDGIMAEAIQLKREVPKRSVRQIIKILELEGWAAPGELKQSTMQRHLYDAGLGVKQMKRYAEKRERSSRRFCRPHRMELLQGDINPITVAIGDSKEMQKAGEMLNEVKESIMDAESWFNAKKAVELGFADGILHEGESTDESEDMALEGMMFSRTAVANSLLTKLIPKKPEAKVPIEQLEKRLQLLSH